MSETELTQAMEQPASVGVSVWTDKEQFNQLLRAADMLSKTTMVPQSYQGKPQDCFLALEIAGRMGLSPLAVMQNMYMVKGKPSWAGQACMMLINSCGKFRDVRPVYTGAKGKDDRGCYIQAVRINDGEVVQGTEVTLKMAAAEGWATNSKWRNMPEQMLAYRAASFFARVYCPEALMGAQTVEEVEDVSSARSTAQRIKEAIKAEGTEKK